MEAAGRYLVALAAALVLLAPLAHGVEVEEGVEFRMGGGNSSVEFAHNESFDSLTVREDSVLFGDWYVSVDHSGNRLMNVTVWNHSLANLLRTPTLQVETSEGSEADLEFGNAQTGHEYRVERDGTSIGEFEVGSDGRLAWSATELDSPHNYTAILLAELLNVTLRLKGDFDHPNDEVYIDGGQRGEGTYTDEELDFGYASFELGGRVAGIVPAGSFVRLEYRDLSDTQQISQTQDSDNNIFLVPFTEGGHEVIEDRENVIQGNLFGSGNFLGFPSPNFAYELSQEKTVRVILSYDSLTLEGFNESIQQGSYTLIIQNRGQEEGKVRITQQ